MHGLRISTQWLAKRILRGLSYEKALSQWRGLRKAIRREWGRQRGKSLYRTTRRRLRWKFHTPAKARQLGRYEINQLMFSRHALAASLRYHSDRWNPDAVQVMDATFLAWKDRKDRDVVL